MRERREGIVKKLTNSRPIRNVGKMLMEHNAKKIVYKYPDNCYSDPMAILMEEIVVRENIRRDENGKRIRTKDELEELKKFDVRSKEALAKRRGGITIGTITAEETERQKKDAEARVQERRGGEQRGKAPSFISKANASADSVAVSMEKTHRVSNIVTKGRRDAKPGLKLGNLDTVIDAVEHYS